MSPEERQMRGERAAHLLEVPAFREAMDACLRLIQTRWTITKPDDPESRETLYHQFNAVHAIEDMLATFVEEGTRAERELKNGD